MTNPTAFGGDAADAFHVIAPSLPGFGFSQKPMSSGWGVDKIADVFAQLMAIHLTLAMGARPKIDGEPTAEEQRALDGITYYSEWDSGYSKQQATRPQTVGYGLVDSPAGQAAWINGNGASSARLYWESFGSGTRHTVNIPSGFAVFPKEIVPPVRHWVESAFTDIRHWSEHDKGGHFAAFEVPEVFVDELRTFFRLFR